VANPSAPASAAGPTNGFAGMNTTEPLIALADLSTRLRDASRVLSQAPPRVFEELASLQWPDPDESLTQAGFFARGFTPETLAVWAAFDAFDRADAFLQLVAWARHRIDDESVAEVYRRSTWIIALVQEIRNHNISNSTPGVEQLERLARDCRALAEKDQLSLLLKTDLRTTPEIQWAPWPPIPLKHLASKIPCEPKSRTLKGKLKSMNSDLRKWPNGYQVRIDKMDPAMARIFTGGA
jgi:hypothetical protein